MLDIEYLQLLYGQYAHLVGVDFMKTVCMFDNTVAIVDDADYDKVGHLKWHSRRAGHTCYAFHNERFKRETVVISMHRLLIGSPLIGEIDHINGNGLDNRRENLRIVTHKQNMHNKHHGTSKFVGVSWLQTRNRWYSAIKFNGRNRFLGTFKNEIDAAAAYRVASICLFGLDTTPWLHCPSCRGG